MSTVLLVAGLVLLAPGLLAAAHLLLLALASLAYRTPAPTGDQAVRFLVMVPAHDEEAVIGATLRALRAAMRPWDALLVVADHCTDRTAAIARAAGAVVLERTGGPAGRAEARQEALSYALPRDDWDALVMVDADSIVSPEFFARCAAALGPGTLALQARSEAALGPGLVSRAQQAAFALQGVTVPRGRDVLGVSVRLRGTGMVLRREALTGRAFRAAASEDLWFGLDLCLDGILPRHVDDARLRSENTASWGAAGNQRMRYEAGRMAAAREFLRPLLRRRTRACLEAAVFLATPPLSQAVLSLVLGGLVGLAAGSAVLLLLAGAGLLALGIVVVTGLLQARVPRAVWLSLLAVPWYVAWKAVVQVRALVSLTRPTTYGATPRA